MFNLPVNFDLITELISNGFVECNGKIKLNNEINNNLLKWGIDYEKDIICYFTMWGYGFGFNHL